ncbi:MAG: pitrilysin family protein [Planctomycetota bacterium]|nr:pitrilysin family protein [Planctomycetota bacterium]
MKHTLLLAASLVAGCSTMTADQTTQPNGTATVDRSTAASRSKGGTFPYAVQRATLDNGLRVVLIPMPSDGLASYWTVVRTGSRDEVEKGVTGFAHFFEHMMFRGTERNPGKVYDSIVNGMGADANAYTTDDYTAYHLSVGTQDLPTVIDIESDRFQNLKYDEDQFRTESGAVYGEYRKGRSSPFEVLFESLQNTAFDAHTYKHTTIGFEADIQAMPRQYEYSKGFFQRFYRPENVVLVVTGDFDPASTLREIRAKYGPWKKGYTAPQVPVEPKQTAMRRVDIPFDGQTLPLLVLAFKGPAFDPADRPTVAGSIVGELAFGPTSPLYKKLVLDEQRVEMLGASFDASRDPGLWSVYTLVKDPADVRAVESELWAAVDGLARTPISQASLDAVRSSRRYGFLTALTTPDGVASSVARVVAHTGDVAAIDTQYETLAAVTPEDVRLAAARWLVREGATVATLHTRDQVVPESASKTTPKPLADAGAARPVEPIAKATGERLAQQPVLLPIPEDPTVSIQLWIQCGSQDDPPGKEGLAALTAAMVSEASTRQRSYDEVLRALFPMSASYSATTDRDMTIVGGLVHRDLADRFARLVCEAVAEPAFKTEDFERLRAGAISSIENDLRFASGEELGKATLMERVFRGTRYAHVEAGNVAALKALTLDDVKSFHATHWTRKNIVVGLGGGYSAGLPDAISSAIASKVAAGADPKKPAVNPEPVRGRQVVLVDNPSAIGTSISFGVPIPLRRGDRDFYALWIANSWLGEHRNSASHLYQVIREARGLNYGNYSYIEAFPRGGRRSMPPTGVGRSKQMFEVWIRTISTENAAFAIRAAVREVETLAKNGLTKEQFEFTRNFLRGYTTHFAESTYDRLGYAIDDRYYGIDGHLGRFRAMLDRLTREEVNAAIAKYMRTEDMVLAAVTNDAAGLKAALTSNAPTPVVYPKDGAKGAEVTAEDAIIAAYPLGISAGNVTTIPVAEMFEAGARP